MPDLISPIRIRGADLRKMKEHSSRCLPEEACGMLGGQGDTVKLVIPTTNIMHSPVKFQIDPLEQLKAFQKFETKGLEMVGYFHSHPAGPDSPSQTDIKMHFYPGCAVVILSDYPKWQINAYLIEKGSVIQIPILEI